jgi:hypothetical protein
MGAALPSHLPGLRKTTKILHDRISNWVPPEHMTDTFPLCFALYKTGNDVAELFENMVTNQNKI